MGRWVLYFHLTWPLRTLSAYRLPSQLPMNNICPPSAGEDDSSGTGLPMEVFHKNLPVIASKQYSFKSSPPTNTRPLAPAAEMLKLSGPANFQRVCPLLASTA